MREWSLGVDLGTSYCAGATVVVSGDEARIEPLEVAGERRVPSTVLLDGDRLLAGTHAQRAMGRSPDRAERNPKNYVGRTPMLLGSTPVTAEDALAAQLRGFVTEARRRFDDTLPSTLVLTHPVAWTENQRGVLRAAATAVLPTVTLHLLDEPVAAAWHYAHEHHLEPGDGVAVYDLGGGTFDAAVLVARADGFEVVGSPGGDTEIGGESFDERVFSHFAEQLERLAPEWWAEVTGDPDDHRSATALAELLREARLAKEALSDYPTASQYVSGADTDVTITRDEFEAMIGEDVDRTDRLMAEVITGSRLDPASLRGIFLTGGASRTPLVQTTLKARHANLVRTWSDPKVCVALGAARWAAAQNRGTTIVVDPVPRERAAPGRVDPVPRGSGRTGRPPAGSRLEPVVDGVASARVNQGWLYTLGAPEPSGRTVMQRHSPQDGRPDRYATFGPVCGWVASDHGLLVAERIGPGVALHAFGPDLTLHSTRIVTAPGDPVLALQDDVGWAMVPDGQVRPVGPADRLPFGEMGTVAVETVRLGVPAGVPQGPGRTVLGRSASWFVDEDGRTRRLLDPAASGGAPLSVLGDGIGAGVVLGGPVRGRGGLGSLLGGGQAQGAAHQSLYVLTALGPQQIGERHPGPDTAWVHQMARLPGPGPWYLATSAGLETAESLTPGAGRRIFVQRPPAGAARWVPAGAIAFGVVVDRIVGAGGLSLHVVSGGRRRELGRWPGLLGNPVSTWAADRPRIVAATGRMWAGVVNDAGGSDLVRADVDGAAVLASAPGWLEPVGRAGDALFALHAPDDAPGERRRGVGRIVRVPRRPD